METVQTETTPTPKKSFKAPTTTDKPTADYEKDLTITLPIKAVWMHKSIIIDGRTETTINKTKVPTIKEMGWNYKGQFVIKANSIHVLPSAQVCDSIV